MGRLEQPESKGINIPMLRSLLHLRQCFLLLSSLPPAWNSLHMQRLFLRTTQAAPCTLGFSHVPFSLSLSLSLPLDLDLGLTVSIQLHLAQISTLQTTHLKCVSVRAYWEAHTAIQYCHYSVAIELYHRYSHWAHLLKLRLLVIQIMPA